MALLSVPLYILFSLPCTVLHSRLAVNMPHLVPTFWLSVLTSVPILSCSFEADSAELPLRTRTNGVTDFILWASRWNCGSMALMTEWNDSSFSSSNVKSVPTFSWTQWALKLYHTHVTAAEYFCLSFWVISVSWFRTLADRGFII